MSFTKVVVYLLAVVVAATGFEWVINPDSRWWEAGLAWLALGSLYGVFFAVVECCVWVSMWRFRKQQRATS